MPTGWSDDDALMHDLGDALAERSETPDRIARAGRDLYIWRTIDAELSELTADSASLVSRGSAIVRTDDRTRRSLTFRASRLVIEVDVEPDPGALRGQLVTSDDAELPTELVVDIVGHDSITTAIDEVGYFNVSPFRVEGARFRLHCGGVLTPWID